jgi:hypothetical protein
LAFFILSLKFIIERKNIVQRLLCLVL